MPPGQPMEIPYQKPKTPPLPKSEFIKKEEEKPKKKEEEEPKPGETAEAATTRLHEEYIAKGKEDGARGQQAVAKAVENGEKEGLKVF